MIGERFGRLVVEHRVGVDPHRTILWSCRCDCGGAVTVRTDALTTGNTKSCGCLRRDRAREMRTTHGGAVKSRRRESLYHIWAGMIARCTNPRHVGYRRYGGAGITVCEKWRKDFAAFTVDVGPRPSFSYSIDRINPFGDYEPGNVRWATHHEQANNRRPRAAR